VQTLEHGLPIVKFEVHVLNVLFDFLGGEILGLDGRHLLKKWKKRKRTQPSGGGAWKQRETVVGAPFYL
jgi:hypothetical protein